MQHGIVTAFETESGPVLYELKLGSVLWRMYIPKSVY
jgi:hypothetical protein